MYRVYAPCVLLHTHTHVASSCVRSYRALDQFIASQPAGQPCSVRAAVRNLFQQMAHFFIRATENAFEGSRTQTPTISESIVGETRKLLCGMKCNSGT
jgi:hypothetical protein